MLRYIFILFLNAFVVFCLAIDSVDTYGIDVVEPGPRFPPTKGEVWPMPQHETKKDTFFVFYPAHFTVKVVGETCPLLTSTVDRYVYLLGRYRALLRPRRRSRRAVEPTERCEGYPHGMNITCGKMRQRRGGRRARAALRQLAVELTAPCAHYPHLGMDESYALTVAASSRLKSDSIWGVMRGLETFAQLIYPSDTYDELRINATEIIDYPRYSHRGLLLDTSRHFISVKNILLTLDAMAMNKMNVFHWHIVDDQSFPYESEKFPELSERGAYHPSMVYTKADVALVVRYARERGIRVVPEFDVPGHTRSWGVAYPNILTECYEDNKVVGLGPMDPINNATYKLLQELITEVAKSFPDQYYHTGGDEVNFDCWASNPRLLDYMARHNMSNVNQFHTLFMTKVMPLLRDKHPVVWQEVFDKNVPLPQNVLVQVWKGGYEREIDRILKAGHKVLFSAAWYLDWLSTGGNWEEFYKADPRKSVTNASLASNVVGGEACMWGEVVDDRNVISRVWPRASAVAEVLWSAPLSTNSSQLKWDLDEARRRLEEHTCRMLRRDIAAQPPNGPGFCVV